MRAPFLIAAFLLSLLNSQAVAQELGDHPCWSVEPQAEPDVAVVACTDAIEAFKGDDESEGVAYLYRGIANRTLRDFEQSVRDIERSLDLLGPDAQVLRMLAWTYREMDRSERTEALYTQSLELDDHWQGRLSRCVVRTDLQRYQEALSDCRTAADQYAVADDAIGPNLDLAFFLAYSLNNLGRHDEAYQAAISEIHHPDISGRLYLQALIAQWNGGRKSEVLPLLQEGLRRYPDDPDILYFIESAGLR